MLIKWAIKWGINPQAVQELRTMMGTWPAAMLTAPTGGTSEAAVSARVRLAAARQGIQLWRNNVGALRDERGVPVRYGLANDSKALNAVFKSSDLIGIDSNPIEPEDVGKPRGQFVALECKESGWSYTGDAHELAQLAFIKVVLAYGGKAQFINDERML